MTVETLRSDAWQSFPRWETTREVIDEVLDLVLDHRQSGHPGGSRSKVHLLLATLLSGAMRWDIHRPWRRFSDRLVLSAGHTVPVVYATLAVLNEALRERHRITGEARFAFPEEGRHALTVEDLPGFRHRGGLPGHAEMAGKTLVLKFNTGPSGHGIPAAAGEALALKMAGCEGVKVLAIEGEGGLTPGGAAETRAAAWGLGLSNLVFLVDWNDYGIDPHRVSDVVPGTPAEWFEASGWRVAGAEDGSAWGPVTRAVLEAARGENPEGLPSMAWFRTRKGRGYGTYDAASHGVPHPRHGEAFWRLRKSFMERHGVEYPGVDRPAPEDPEARRARLVEHLEVALSVLRRDEALVEDLSERLLSLAGEVPEDMPGCRVPATSRQEDDERLLDHRAYPAAMWSRPGERAPNKLGLARWGAYVNRLAREARGVPRVVACSADLAGSTAVAGFAEGFEGSEGFGWYHRDGNPTGALLPQTITEFTNAGLCVGLSSVNLAPDPREEFAGFWSACSTYGSFSYLKYGLMRLYSQMAQDGDLRLGKVIWVAGHSGPETADDSRTHFGIFAPQVTQLFPRGQVIDLHPWEVNEVPVVLAAALGQEAPIVALHLTRPAIEVPDREALGMPSHHQAARGAYVLRSYRPDAPRAGCVIVRGTSTTANLVRLLPRLDEEGPNVKVVAAISRELFDLQDEAYREETLSRADRWDSMVMTSQSLAAMADWVTHPLVEEYSLSADRDDRWRTGGTLEEIVAEAGLDEESLLAGIRRFARERVRRREALRVAAETLED